MKKSQRSNLVKNNSVDRRTMIKGAMALGLTASIPLHAKAAFGELKRVQEQDTDQEAEEFRLYSLVPSKTARFDGTLRPQPLNVNWSNHTEDRDRISDLGYYMVVWATAEQAATLNESEHIESLTMIDQDSVVVLGQPENANGKLTVRLFPNAAKNQAESGTYASVTEIADQWRQELDNVEGIVITTPGVSKKTAGNAAGRRAGPAADPGPAAPAFPGAAFGPAPPLDGQIVIDFKGDLDETVLATVTSHPQTLLVQWGAIIVPEFCNCPGCGAG